MDIKKAVKDNGKRKSCSKNTSDLQNDRSKITPGKNKVGLSQGLSNGKKLSSNRKCSDKSSTELPNEIIKSKSESSKQIIKKCDSVETRSSKYKNIRKGINKDDEASVPTSSDSKNIKTCLELRKGKENGKLSEKKKSIKSNKTTPTNSDYKKINADIELRKDKLSGKKRINKEDETTLLINSNSKNFKTRIKLGNDKGKNKLSEKKESCKDDDANSLTNSDSKNIKTSFELGKDKVKGKLSENLSFDDIEKKIYEDILTPVKENNSNHKSKLNKNKLLNEQLNKPTCSKTNEKQKSKRISKTFQNDDSLKKINKKVAGKNNSKVKLSKTKEMESSSGESDWEDVDELHEILKSKDKKTTGNVQIELKAENPLWGITKRKRRSEREKIEDYIRKEINKSIREVYENMHKTHLLCLLAHGIYVNRVLHSETLISCALSIIPKQYYSPKRLDINHLEKFVNWFYSHMKIKTITDQKSLEIPENSTSETKTIEDVLIKRFEDKSPACFKEAVIMFVATSRAVGMTVRYVQSLTPISWKPPAANLLKPKKESDETNEILGSSKTEKPEKIIKKKSMKMLSSDSEMEPDDKEIKQKRKKKKAYNKDHSEDSDEVNFDLSTNFRKKGIKASQKKLSKTKVNKNNGSDECNISKKGEIKDWAEVYVEEEEKWIPIDITRNQIHCTSEIENRTLNLAYVIAFNPDNTVKDVTRRYMSSWLSYNNKVRLDNEWWSDALKPFLSLSDKRDKEEDREMDEVLKLQPLPKTINEYKNHPLYALQRHLLKFEALYPPDASPVGFIRGEPVYPRECVKNLGGRDRWIKEAKTVRVNEEPYKIVKANPKWDRNTCQLIKDRPLELFGEWQVEDYEPPIAKNGRVPRNEYGNVDLFKMCMLPRGCVHLPINGLNRVARKINIDCAPAVTGFDYHSGYCHAVYDGFVVCEEFKDILLDAWNQEQIEQAKREEEKRLKRIYDNWKRLINGVTLKERLQEKYGINSQEATLSSENQTKKKEAVKKIKQKDINELPSSIITHSISNVRIDFETSVTDAMKKKRPLKRKLVSNKNKSLIKNTDSLDKSSLHSSDSEDLSDTEKRKKIRSILDWNPNTIDNQSDPALSDESGDETNIGEDPLKNSSLMLTPISESHSLKNSSSASKSSKKSSVRTGDVKFLSSSESEEAPNSPPLKRRSLRSIKSKQNYNENDGTPSDISVGDSDTGDATYHPTPE